MTHHDMTKYPPLPEGPWNGKIPQGWHKVTRETYDPDLPCAIAIDFLSTDNWGVFYPEFVDKQTYIQPDQIVDAIEKVEPKASKYTAEEVEFLDACAIAALLGNWTVQDNGEKLGAFTAQTTDECFEAGAKMYYRQALAMLKARREVMGEG